LTPRQADLRELRQYGSRSPAEVGDVIKASLNRPATLSSFVRVHI
jgi:hypothetical protein